MGIYFSILLPTKLFLLLYADSLHSSITFILVAYVVCFNFACTTPLIGLLCMVLIKSKESCHGINRLGDRELTGCSS